MSRPIEPRQRGNLFQEGQIPVGTAFLLRVALGQIFVELGLGFLLINVGRSQYAREHF